MNDKTKVSQLYKNLVVGPMKKMAKYYSPETIIFAGGLPMDSTFPFSSIQVNVPPTQVKQVEAKPPVAEETQLSFTLRNNETLKLNYHRGYGIGTVQTWIQEHIQQIHHPKIDIATCVTIGSTDSFYKTISLIDSEYIVFDQFAYGAAVNACQVIGKKLLGIPVDGLGMIPDELRRGVLGVRGKGGQVNLIYLTPVGQNPMGFTMSFERKQQIYEVCRELDLIIIEDDAYYYLYFDLEEPEDRQFGTQQLPPSFLSFDEDYRVIRLDSFSKIICPGIRLGIISGSKEFIEKFMLLQEITSQFPSGFSQSIFSGLMNHWKDSVGYHNYCCQVQSHYRRQCQAMISAFQNYFPSNTVDFTIPKGGMFLWVSFPSLRGKFSSKGLWEKLIQEQKVLCLYGEDFYVPSIDDIDRGVEDIAVITASFPPALRLTFASQEPDKIQLGVQKMADVLLPLLTT